MESKFRVHPDVARYNSFDDDNVTQVEKKKSFTNVFTHSFAKGLILFPAGCTCTLPFVQHLTCQIQDSSPICLFQLQVRTFYTQVLNEDHRQRLCQNFAGSLKGAQLFIQKRMASSHTISTPVIDTVFPFLSDALHTCLLLQSDESNSYKNCGLGF